MIFDMLVNIVEKHLREQRPEWVNILKEANIFHFNNGERKLRESGFEFIDLKPKEELKKELGDLFLPFNIVALESKDVCSILKDVKENQVGWERERINIHIIPLTKFNNDIKCVNELVGLVPQDSLAILSGIVSYKGIARFEIDHSPQHIIKKADMLIISKTKGIIPLKSLGLRVGDLSEALAYFCNLNLLKVMRINQEKEFILEELPLNVKERKNSKHRIPKSGSRSVYTVLSPKAIRKKLKILSPGGNGTSKCPHERRRHFRTFHDDRYVKMKGKTIIVPACWVGPSEKVIGNKKYKVRLDL